MTPWTSHVRAEDETGVRPGDGLFVSAECVSIIAGDGAAPTRCVERATGLRA